MPTPSESRPAAQATLQVDNDTVRVTEWRFAPGASTGWHRHGYDYVVVPLTNGALTIDDGTRRAPAELGIGRSYFRQVGVEHDVINDNPFEFVFVEVELKPQG
jgi:quercetin dioxygenase-like cupin family protein